MSWLSEGIKSGLTSGSLIGTGVSAISSLLGASSTSSNIDKQLKAQAEENEKNRQYNYMLAQQQNQWNIDQWNRENEYNSPVSQVQRLSDAGLNTDLAYGSLSGSSGSSVAGSLTSGAPSQPQDMSNLANKPTVGQAVLSALQMENIKAQTNKLKTAADKDKEEITNYTTFRNLDAALKEKYIQLADSDIELKGSTKNLTDAQKDEVYYRCKSLDAQTKDFLASVDTKRAQVQSMKVDNLVKVINTQLNAEKIKAEIQRLAVQNHVDFVTARTMVGRLTLDTLIGKASIVNMDASTRKIYQEISESKSRESLNKILGVKYNAEKNRILFDLNYDKENKLFFDAVDGAASLLNCTSNLINSIVPW